MSGLVPHQCGDVSGQGARRQRWASCGLKRYEQKRQYPYGIVHDREHDQRHHDGQNATTLEGLAAKWAEKEPDSREGSGCLILGEMT